MIVPRKSDTFQDDIYPETAAPIPALTGIDEDTQHALLVSNDINNQFFSAEDWFSGKNATPILLSMKTGSQTRTYKPVCQTQLDLNLGLQHLPCPGGVQAERAGDRRLGAEQRPQVLVPLLGDQA